MGNQMEFWVPWQCLSLGWYSHLGNEPAALPVTTFQLDNRNLSKISINGIIINTSVKVIIDSFIAAHCAILLLG